MFSRKQIHQQWVAIRVSSYDIYKFLLVALVEEHSQRCDKKDLKFFEFLSNQNYAHAQ